MKAAVAILALLMSFDAFAINVAVRATTATGDGQEAQALVDLLKKNGAQGNNGTFSVTGSIWKTAVNCSARKFMYTVSLSEGREVPARDGNFDVSSVDLPTVTAKACEMDSATDKIRAELLKWGANQITDITGSVGFSIECEPTSCFVRLAEGSLFSGGSSVIGGGGSRDPRE